MRVGLVGTGMIAEAHAASWRQLDATIHVYARTPGRRDAFASRHDAVAHTDIDAMLAVTDVVDICTPTDTHAALVLRAAAAGRHVVCEKPLTRTLAEADSVITACRESGVRLFPAHVVRYYPAYAAARSAITEGRHGAPVMLRFDRTSAIPDWAPWLHEYQRSGGILVDFMIHDFDAAQAIAGEVAEAHATLIRTKSVPTSHRALTEARVCLRHVNGAFSHVSGSWGPAGTRFRTGFEIATTTSVLRHASEAGDTVTVRKDSGALTVEPGPYSNPMTAQLADFVSAITKGTTSRVTDDDGRAALAIALAAAESVNRGRAVPVSGSESTLATH